MQIGYGILLNDEAFNHARSLELKLSKEFGAKGGLRQEPHVTIKAPFEASSLNLFEEYFDELVQTTKAFSITLNGIGSFPPNVIFIQVIKDANLINLHQKIITHMESRFQIKPNPFEGEKKVFHTTLAMTDISDTFESQLASLKDEQPNFTFIFDTLGMFLHLGDKEGWIVIRKGKII
jgi:2'-5' RNA ligase